MIARTLASAALAAALLPAAAYAANNSSTGNSNTNAVQTQAVPQQIAQKLKQDGFSDVKIEPGSFIVTAKDKSGNPVEMLIRPTSMLVLTAENNTTKGNGSQNNNDTKQSPGTGQ